jgi:hypothetical protein
VSAHSLPRKGMGAVFPSGGRVMLGILPNIVQQWGGGANLPNTV